MSTAAETPTHPRRRGLLLASLLVIALVAVAGGGWWWFVGREGDPKDVAAEYVAATATDDARGPARLLCRVGRAPERALREAKTQRRTAPVVIGSAKPATGTTPDVRATIVRGTAAGAPFVVGVTTQRVDHHWCVASEWAPTPSDLALEGRD